MSNTSLLLNLLVRCKERVDFLRANEMHQEACSKKEMERLQWRSTTMERLIETLPDVLRAMFEKPCLDRTRETQAFQQGFPGRMTPYRTSTRKGCEDFSQTLETRLADFYGVTGPSPGCIAAILNMAKFLLLNPAPNTVGDRYIVSHRLDESTPVYEAVDAFTGSKVAVKVLDRDYRGLMELAMTRLANQLDPVGCVKLLALETSVPSNPAKPHLAMVLEYLPASLFEQRQSYSRDAPVPIEFIGEVFQSVAESLARLHCGALLHGDIKHDNLMFSGGLARIIDFGLSVRFGMPISKGTLYTVGFVPPELVYLTRKKDTVQSGPAMDIFALGVTMLLCMLPERDDIFESDSVEEYRRVKKALPAIIAEVAVRGPRYAVLGDLLGQMLSYDPDLRPGAARVAQTLAQVRQVVPATPAPVCRGCLTIACATFDPLTSVKMRVSRALELDPGSTDLTENLAEELARNYPSVYTVFAEGLLADPLIVVDLDG